MEIFLQAETWLALLTLVVLEVVLGIDNIIFISIVSQKVPESKQARVRTIGLSLALIFRVLLLLGITWVLQFSTPLFTVFTHEISLRDLLLLLGGAFLLYKATTEIHDKIEGAEHERKVSTKSVAGVLVQIVLLDLVFSIDSILTAIGMTEEIAIMIVAVVIAIVVMMWFAGPVSDFIQQHPTLQVLALSFLLLIGLMLVLDALDVHVPKGYLYFAVTFSLVVEMLNMRLRKRDKTNQKAN